MDLQTVLLERALERYADGALTREHLITRMRECGMEGTLLEENLKVADDIREKFANA